MASKHMRFLLVGLLALGGPLACSARGSTGGGGPVDTDVPVGGDDTPVGTDTIVVDDNPSTGPDVVVTPDRPVTPDVQPSCPPPRAQCGAACVDTLTDTSNCGGCGRACASGQQCNSGTCMTGTPTCTSPRVMCGSSCVDLSTDATNCGVCGFRCSTGQSCSAGNCTGGSTCTTPRRMCGSLCTDITFDATNCGACGVVCPSGQACISSRCTGGSTCTSPMTTCSGVCVNTQTDAANCGFCGNRCATGQTCSAGVCRTGTTTTSRAGAACTNPDPMGGVDPACGTGSLVCVDTQSTPICTNVCENNASQTNEQAQCEGAGSTCLTVGDGATAQSLCAAACRPSSGASACRAGFICTGWWFTHAMGTPDSTGCYGFCTSNAQCTGGMLCNSRTGDCGTTGVVTSRLADGSPCNPTITVTVPGETNPRNVQCRGICFRADSTSTHGICGSMLNQAVSTSCPDDPANVLPRAPTGGTDNLAICLWRNCTRNSNCTSPHICRYPEDSSGTAITTLDRTCDYPTASQSTGVP